MRNTQSAAGFSLIELLVATGLLLIISTIVTQALMQMTQSQTTIWNRTEMHSGIRGATELLQQEVGQAGRINTPNTIVLNTTINAVAGPNPAAQATCTPEFPLTGAVTVNVSSTAGLWATPGPPASYVNLTTLDGDNQESVRIASVGGGTITACFTRGHAVGTVLVPMGGFATGIIPPAGVLNASNGNVLKMYGDINGDGNMKYVEYTCDYGQRNLYRNVMAWDAGVKPPNSEILLSNIIPNPDASPCFTYQTTSMTVQGTPFTFVLDVAITLTVETEQIDPVTKQKQTETKALLNVSPRNVFNAWLLASIGYTDRIQSTPATITALLP